MASKKGQIIAGYLSDLTIIHISENSGTEQVLHKTLIEAESTKWMQKPIPVCFNENSNNIIPY